MTEYPRGTRVQVFLGESDHVGHRPRYEALLEYLRREGAAGATVIRGVAGFGAASQIHTAAILRLSMDLPMIVTWIDAPRRVERLLPGLRALAGSGIITVEEVAVAAYGGRRLDQLRFDLEVRDAMTAPAASIDLDAPARSAVELMIDKPYRALPVVDATNRLAGLLSNGDLVSRAGLPMRLELLEAMPAEARAEMVARIPANLRVRDVMSAPAVSIGALERVAAATRRLSERRIKRLPVVDEAGRLLGVVSRSDILRAVAEVFPRPEPGEGGLPDGRTVRELMRTDGPVVPGSASLEELLRVVVSTRLNVAVVVDDDRHVLGVLTDADVLRSIAPAARSGVVRALMQHGHGASGPQTSALILAGPPATVPAGATLSEAAALMLANESRILPIVDGDGRLLGIVDRADLLRASRAVLDQLAGLPIGDDAG